MTLNENLALVATIDPQLTNGGCLHSDWVNMKLFGRVMFVISLGATDTTYDAELKAATDSSGCNQVCITGKRITQMPCTDDNKQAIIEVAVEELPDSDHHYVACKVDVGSNVSGAFHSVVALAGSSRYAPATADDLCSVVQVLA